MWVKTIWSISRWRHLLMWQPEAHWFLLQKILFFHSSQIWTTKTKFVNSQYRYLQKPCYNKHPFPWNLNRQTVIKTVKDKNVINHVLLKFNENWKYFKSSLNEWKNSTACSLDRSSSVGRAIYRGAGGRGFDSWARTYTQGLKITKEEGISFGLQTARYLRGSDYHAL